VEIGRWKSSLRTAGGLILAYASLGLLWPFATKHQRDVLAAAGATWSDTAHVVLGAVTVFLMLLAIGFGAAAFGKRFRLYSIATIVVLLVFSGLTFLEAPRLQIVERDAKVVIRERLHSNDILQHTSTPAARSASTAAAAGASFQSSSSSSRCAAAHSITRPSARGDSMPSRTAGDSIARIAAVLHTARENAAADDRWSS
jgi:hypothetical protein